MQIDWITVAAQIVNFLILVWLLQHFLYRPIMDAMARREQRIADRLDDARRRERAAEDEAERHRAAQRDLDDRREALVAEARDEADDERKRLVGEARAEADRLARQWRDEVAAERRRFLDDLRKTAASRLTAIARAALADLADAELEDRVATVFVDRLTGLADDDRRAVAEAAQAEGRVAVTSAFDLPGPRKTQITKAVHALAGREVEVAYARSSELTCGVALSAGGRRVAWSLDGWVDALAGDLEAALEPPGRRGDHARDDGETEARSADDAAESRDDRRGASSGDSPGDRAVEAG
jgi:F-type H+-transporting ATPase subunit b